MVSKDTIAEILGIDEDNISDSIYAWGLKNFFILSDLSSEETVYEYSKFISRSTQWVKLPKTNIKSIDTISLDGDDVGTLTTDLIKVNPRTGLVKYTGGFGAGQLADITYTTSAYTHEDIHDYVIALFVLKGMSIFTPQYTNQVKRIKIGRFQKDFGGVEANLSMLLKTLDIEIDIMIARLQGGNEGLGIGEVI